jgi:hypothetical protein
MRPVLEAADVFRRHGEAFRRDRGAHLGRVERRVMAAIEACRTAALGGHVEQCGECGLTRPAYNSCRNRHCPKCQGLARAEWLEARQAELLPVPCSPCRRRRRRSPSTTSGSSTPSCSVRRPTRCATLPPIRATSAPRSVRSPCCTPGGRRCSTIRTCTVSSQGADCRPARQGGSPARPGSFLPVRVLARRFRTLFLDRLRAAFAAGELRFSGALADLAEPARFAGCLGALRGTEWVVPLIRWSTMTFLAVLRTSGITAPCVFDGPINGCLFQAWVEQFLRADAAPWRHRRAR